jgi:hypothetical protein
VEAVFFCCASSVNILNEWLQLFTQNFKSYTMYVEFADILPKRTLLYLRLTSIMDSLTELHKFLFIFKVPFQSRIVRKVGEVTEIGSEK